MSNSSFRRKTALFTGLIALSFAAGAQAQVLDAPQTYNLPTVDPENIFYYQGSSVTLNAGEIDTSVTSTIGDQPLNDVVVLSATTYNIQAGIGIPATGRVYSLVHTSGTDTQALGLATLVDVDTNSNDPDRCYEIPNSLQILDLDGDDTDDLGFISACFPVGGGFKLQEGQVFGMQGSGSDPFQIPSTLTLMGQQNGGGVVSNATFMIQNQLESGDFNNDGRTDLAVYDATFQGTPTSQIQVMLNDGLVGTLPTQFSSIDDPTGDPDDVNVVVLDSADYNGDGNLDIAIAYDAIVNDDDAGFLFAYAGNGDGTFAQAPIASVSLGQNIIPNGLASGDFDGNGFLDFAVGAEDDDPDAMNLFIVTCSPGSPASCQTDSIPIVDDDFLPVNVAAGDFNNDGLDDIVNTTANFFQPQAQGTTELDGFVQLRLNNGSGFNDAADQILEFNETGFTDDLVEQVIVKDIDACGGPDVAFTGILSNPFPATGADAQEIANQVAVAFNPNEAPTANAGEATQVDGGYQVGGTAEQPTCSDPTDDAMEITWTVISGNATLSSSTVANPIVTGGSGEIVLQVTCTDACGLSDTDTVTVPATGFIQGSCTSLMGVASVPFNATWIMIPAALGVMGALRRKKS